MVSHDLKSHGVDQVEEGVSLRKAASEFVSKSTLGAASKAKRENGFIPQNGKSSGPPRKIGPLHAQFIIATVQQRPTILQDEIRIMLERFYGLHVNTTTIGRFLGALGFSHKKVTPRAIQQDEDQRREYALLIGQFSPSQLVFADESHFNRRTGDRVRGWARRGEKAEDRRILARGTRYSLLPALAIDGIYAPWIIEGSVNTERFHYWVRNHLLPHTSPFPGPRSVIVIDNCSTHKNPELREIIENAGRLLIFLPAYSPDYSPIEFAFGIIKRYLKRNPANDPYDIIKATYESVTPAHAEAFFRAAGYGRSAAIIQQHESRPNVE